MESATSFFLKKEVNRKIVQANSNKVLCLSVYILAYLIDFKKRTKLLI